MVEVALNMDLETEKMLDQTSYSNTVWFSFKDEYIYTCVQQNKARKKKSIFYYRGTERL